MNKLTDADLAIDEVMTIMRRHDQDVWFLILAGLVGRINADRPLNGGPVLELTTVFDDDEDEESEA